MGNKCKPLKALTQNIYQKFIGFFIKRSFWGPLLSLMIKHICLEFLNFRGKLVPSCLNGYLNFGTKIVLKQNRGDT